MLCPPKSAPKTARSVAFALLLPLLACVPADAETGLGSVQFTFVPSQATLQGLDENTTADQYSLAIDRVVLSFKTMTVGKIGAPNLCSYTGRGAQADAVFDLKTGVVQTFNGISPVFCPDVGVIFGLVDNATVPAAGTPSAELIELAQLGYHGLIDATARQPSQFDNAGTVTPGRSWKIQLRFEPVFTATRFGGCTERDTGKGVQIVEGQRQKVNMIFAAENFFRATDTSYRIAPFIQADLLGNNDGVTTMTELDQLALTSLGHLYQLPTDFKDIKGDFPTLGDFVRYLFRFAILYEQEDGGLCIGNAPGATSP